MTVPALPRRWCEILVLVGLTFGLTVTLVTGAEPEQCGTNSLCGHGTRCDTNTTRCVCLSDDGDRTKRKGKPFSLYYCLGGGVIECGDKLCGYRAECNTDRSGCRCSFNNAEPGELTGTSPSLWYCVEKCDLRGSMCPDNTTCRNSTVNNRHLCQCSEEATQSSTGQCLGKPSNVHVTTEGDSPTQSDDSRILTIGLAAGIGGVVLVAVIVLIVVVLARRRASRRASDNEGLG
ncbi:uncharacterized protein LOC135462952 [Liolophura sinensis]|uniref:uncharacterized protein LOC135462952 n=1 Tax=Liolophura sinensis TaxID=3198878 RepID=UPI0031594F45